MNNPSNLLHYILFGDFGLFTLTPRYLFLVLFPVLTLLGVFAQLLPRLPGLSSRPVARGYLFYCVVGLGCTTAALAALAQHGERRKSDFLNWMLILLVPCSSQIATAAAFASMVSFRVFLCYLLFTLLTMTCVYAVLLRFAPKPCAVSRAPLPSRRFFLWPVIKDAFTAVVRTIPPFACGSLIISLCIFLGLMDGLRALLGPALECFLRLPEEATELLLLNFLKRDFGSAGLLAFAGDGSFSATQLTTLLLMMTFSVPCFNTTVLLCKQRGLPAVYLWLGALALSLLVGKIAATVFFICGF